MIKAKFVCGSVSGAKDSPVVNVELQLIRGGDESDAFHSHAPWGQQLYRNVPAGLFSEGKVYEVEIRERGNSDEATERRSDAG